MGHFDFDNNVTMFSLSKTFCMPALRAGFMCGPKEIIEAASTAVMRTSSAMSLPSEMALKVSFSNKYAKERETYIAANNTGYLKRYDVLKAMVDGIDTIADTSNTRREEITSIAKRIFANNKQTDTVLANGIEGIKIVNDKMDAGYFAVLQIQNFDSLYYGTKKLRDSSHFSSACVDQGHVLTLPMTSAFAGEHEELYNSIRVTFGLSEEKIVKGLRGIYHTMQTLTEKPDPVLQDKLAKEGLNLD